MWKLQKLCCYAQAWHAAWTDRRLIAQRFEARANGPVCPELYDRLRGNYEVAENDLSEGDPDALNADEKESVDVVLASYGAKDPYDLREMTRSEDPWRAARGDIPEGEPCRNEIPIESMAMYYGGL